MTSKIKAVIFDMDGTLIDSMGIWHEVDKEYLKKRNLNVPKNLFEDMKSGNSFREVALYFKNKFDLEDSIEEIMKEWTDMVFEHYKNKIDLKPDAFEFLTFLKKAKIKLALGTSNTKHLAHINLKKNNIFSLFDVIITGEEKIKGKPHPDIYLKAAKNLNIQPQNCLVIEDVLEGVQAAKKANMTVWAVRDSFSHKQRARIKKEADFFALSFSEIIKKFKSLNNF